MTVASVGALALILAACGGGDGDDAGTSTTTSSISPTVTISTSTTVATEITDPPPLTPPELVLVTDGAKVVVANASGVDGAAGRMSNALKTAGFDTVDATNSSEGQLGTTKVYYDPANSAAKAVADSVREALGAGTITVLELTTPAPLRDPAALGDATVLVAMGNDVADRTLDQLQGRTTTATDDEDEDSAEGTADAGT